mgnify:CR=1 FL=1
MRYTALLLAFLLARPAQAEPCTASRPLQAGATAPCTGVLVPVAKLDVAIRCLGVDLPTCQADAHRAAAVSLATTDALTAKLAACANLVAQRGVELDACLAQPRVVVRPPPPAWYAAGWAAVVAGVAVGAVAGGALVWRLK